MKKKTITAFTLLILLTTISFQQKITFSKFNIKRIDIENNLITKEQELKKSLQPIYNRNIFFLKKKEIKEILISNTFIDSFDVKKKYPNTLKIRVFEKKPIAILLKKKKKFYISEKIKLIKYKNLSNYQSLPYIIGDEVNFKILYINLKKINFPLNRIKKYTFYEANRWDIQTKNNKIIKLPTENYIQNLENYLKLETNSEFKKYKIFDYRIKNQLILK
jgi:cell division protein FtsQ